MNQDMDWSQYPQLASLDPQKLQFLSELSRTIKNLPQNQRLNALMRLQTEARQKQLSFSDAETLLIVSAFRSSMSPEDAKKLELLHLLAKKLSKKDSP